MKKSIMLSFFVAVFSVVSAQQVISNGEDIGTAWWPAGSAGAVDVWDNPLKDGVNNSDKSITVWINNSDVDYTGAGISGLNIDVAAYNTLSVMVYKLIEGKVRLELQDGISNYFVVANYNTPGAWQKLTFKIPSGIGNIQTLLVAPHFENYQTNPIPDGEAHRMWWDEIVAYFDINSGINEIPFPLNHEYTTTEIYSSNGSLIKKISGNFSVRDLNLPQGLYILKQKDVKNGVPSISKIFVQ
ncbi:hypothetical protein RDV77_01640 [Porphyromonadaceae sp. NP-X]|jgi:hypothetical protein|nr:hypothetical protein [Porphyromonadaceae sp. NP-X]